MKENTHADEAEVKSTHQELATCSNTACLSLVPWRQFFLSWPALHYLSIWSVKSLLGWIDLCFPLFLVILQIHLANSSLGPHFRSPIPSLSFLRNSLGKYNHVSSCVLSAALHNISFLIYMTYALEMFQHICTLLCSLVCWQKRHMVMTTGGAQQRPRNLLP